MLILILLLHPGYSQTTWKAPRILFWYSDNLSPVTGGEDLLSLHYGLGRLEDNYLPPSPWEESGWLGKVGAIGYRALKINFIDFDLLDFFTAIPQHEIFGHGYRVREFGFDDISYTFSAPYPYGKGYGLTEFTYPKTGRTPDQELAVATAGVEASAVMADKLRGYWLLAGNMDFHGALLYITTSGDLRSYLAQTEESKITTDPDLSNDMSNYILGLNGKVGRSNPDNFRLHLSRIEKMSNLTYGDPFLWYSWWTVLKTQLWSGESVFDYPSIPIGPVHDIPLLGYGLTPWGPEYLFQNMAEFNGRVYSLKGRIGDDTFRKYWGLDLEGINAVSLAGFDLDIGLHMWKQPRLRLEVDDQGITPSFWGGAISLNLISPLLDLPTPIRLAGGGDYKSSGFVPGLNLASGLAWRIGLNIQL